MRREGRSDDGRRSRNVEIAATLAPPHPLSELQQTLLHLERVLILTNSARRHPLRGVVYYRWIAKRAHCDWRKARELLEASERLLELD